MTRKDYKLAVKVIKSESDSYGPWKDDFISMFITFFSADNSTFDSKQFADACNEEMK